MATMKSSGGQAGLHRPLTGSLLTFAAVAAAVTLIRAMELPLSSLLVPALWGFGALLPGWRGGFPPPVLGISPPRLIKGLKLFLLSSAIVFPLYGALFYLSVEFGLPRPADLVPEGVTVFHWTVFNFTVVAFVEELFFRGYLQGRLEDSALNLFKSKRAIFWFPAVGTAFLFALAHAAADLEPARMAVFFPGLLFGWLRAKTGVVLAPVLSHGTANVVSMLLIRSVNGHW